MNRSSLTSCVPMGWGRAVWRMAALACAGGCVGAWAAATDTGHQDAPDLKLTAGIYRYAHDEGKDLNLRWTRGDNHLWLGHYEDRGFGKQDRLGWDGSVALADGVALQPSLQAATGGFLGGSVNLQVGHDTYGVLGWGRTNLRPYFNLNFDPNDAITVGLGHNFDDGQVWSVTVIRDDRLHTGQTDRHLTGRVPVGADRLTLDLMYKTGQGDEGHVKGWGCSLTWDFPRWFLRLAHDPKQNFSSQNATRLSGGVRF